MPYIIKQEIKKCLDFLVEIAISADMACMAKEIVKEESTVMVTGRNVMKKKDALKSDSSAARKKLWNVAKKIDAKQII